jgi:hypothetical protein
VSSAEFLNLPSNAQDLLVKIEVLKRHAKEFSLTHPAGCRQFRQRARCVGMRIDQAADCLVIPYLNFGRLLNRWPYHRRFSRILLDRLVGNGKVKAAPRGRSRRRHGGRPALPLELSCRTAPAPGRLARRPRPSGRLGIPQ